MLKTKGINDLASQNPAKNSKVGCLGAIKNSGKVLV